jgi:dolichyl-phosphate-mannose--protein O-mannosyl transferase
MGLDSCTEEQSLGMEGRNPDSPFRKTSRRKTIITCLLLGLSALTLFTVFINRPPIPVFDEGTYIGAIRSILAGGDFPLPEHPPLGKYLFAAGVAIAGDNPVGWRIASAVCGALTIVAVFLWSVVLLGDYSLALTAAGLTLLNNFLFVMARTTMLDVPMFMFSMWGLAGFTAAVELPIGVHARRIFLLFSGLMFGLAGACKWTAVDTFAVVLATSFALLAFGRFRPAILNANLARQAQNLREIGFPALFLGLVLLPIVSYSLTYLPVFRANHLTFSLTELARMHARMWSLSKAFTGNRFIYSPWYSWPFTASPQRLLPDLMGNLVVMWGGLLALGICMRRIWKHFASAETFIVLLYAANLAQWAVTPRSVTYYYYYFSAAMFLGAAIAVALRRAPRPRIFGVRVAFIALSAAAVFFLYWYPRMAHLNAPWDCLFGCWS